MKNARSEYNLALQSLATSFGFGFNPNHAFQGTVMSGTLVSHRCDISFETVRRRSRNNRSSTYMHVTIALNVPTQLGLSMTRQGFLSEGFRLPDSITGNQDIIIGEETFDETYRVKGIDENADSRLFHASTNYGYTPNSKLTWTTSEPHTNRPASFCTVSKCNV